MSGSKKILICYISLLFITIITLGSTLFNMKSDNKKIMYNNFSNNWTTETDEKVDLKKIYLYNAISNIIPDLDNDKTLFFNVKNANIKVYINDTLVYQSAIFNHKIHGKTPGSYFVKIPIYKEYQKQKIKIVVDSPYTDDSSKITAMTLGNGVDIILNRISSGMIGLVISSCILFFGLILLILYLPMWKNKLIGSEMLNLGLFSFSIGIFMFFDGKTFQLIMGNEYLYHTISSMFMMLVVVPLILFLEKIYHKKNTKLSYVICIMCLIDFIICYLFNIFEILDFHQTVIITHITYIIAMIYIVLMTIMSLVKSRKIYHSIAIIIICFCVLLDIVILYKGSYIETSFFTRIGVLLFLCFESAEIFTEHLKKYRNNIKVELLSKLAYHDGLTNLLNRTSFIESMESIKKKNEISGIIAIFDVNNLKYINDHLGHAIGDEMIITVANIINNNLNEFGDCYRIGGDEFVFISNIPNFENTFLTSHNKIKNDLKKYNKKDNNYKISVAMGYTVLDNKKGIEIDKAFNEADKKMYKNKKKIKARIKFF